MKKLIVYLAILQLVTAGCLAIGSVVLYIKADGWKRANDLDSFANTFKTYGELVEAQKVTYDKFHEAVPSYRKTISDLSSAITTTDATLKTTLTAIRDVSIMKAKPFEKVIAPIIAQTQPLSNAKESLNKTIATIDNYEINTHPKMLSAFSSTSDSFKKLEATLRESALQTNTMSVAFLIFGLFLSFVLMVNSAFVLASNYSQKKELSKG